MSTLLIILLILILVGGVGFAPAWGWHGYGWAPAGGWVGLLLVILLVLALLGRL